MTTSPRRIGVGIVELRGAPTFGAMRDRLLRAKQAGFASAWIDAVFGWDALTALAAIGPPVPDIELGTAVVPIYPRHPVVLAQQALTVSELLGGRLTLGIGTSHKVVVEELMGYSFDRPGTQMAEHLDILLALLRNGSVDFAGEVMRARVHLKDMPKSAMPVLLGALAPRMLHLAGAVADGAIVWLANAHALRTYVVPALQRAAESADRPMPRLVCAMPVCVTDDAQAARAHAASTFALYGRLPSYRRMMDHSEADGPEDAAIIADEDRVAEQIDELFEAGATDVLPALFGRGGDTERGWELMASLARRWSATPEHAAG